MADRKKPKFYVVWEGRQPGVYDSWDIASQQVAGYANAKYKSFASKAEAEDAYRGAYWNYVGKAAANAPRTPTPRTLEELAELGVVLDSVAVDAACSGVPGPMEYQGVHIETGAQIFHEGPFPDGTNNVGEFLAIVHALSQLQESGNTDMTIYSDSVNAMGWVKQGVCRTQLVQTSRNRPIFERIDQALAWLRHNPVTNPILKWRTEDWGEIPADFGRK